MTFVTGAGDIHEARLLDHATVVSGSETAATVIIESFPVLVTTISFSQFPQKRG